MEDGNIDPNIKSGAKFSTREDLATETDGLDPNAVDRYGANNQTGAIIDFKEFKEPTNTDISELAAKYGPDINRSDDDGMDDKDPRDFGGERGPIPPSLPPSDTGANALPIPTEDDFRASTGQVITPPEQTVMKPTAQQIIHQ
jgi:hypothetical protein